METFPLKHGVQVFGYLGHARRQGHQWRYNRSRRQSRVSLFSWCRALRKGTYQGIFADILLAYERHRLGSGWRLFTKVSNPNAREGRGRAVNERRLRDLVAMETRNRTPHQPDMTTVRISPSIPVRPVSQRQLADLHDGGMPVCHPTISCLHGNGTTMAFCHSDLAAGLGLQCGWSRVKPQGLTQANKCRGKVQRVAAFSPFYLLVNSTMRFPPGLSNSYFFALSSHAAEPLFL